MQHAAVLIPIVLAPEPYVIFVRRAAHLRRNPGQIAFPGGLLDPGESPREAALRECFEEIGTDASAISILGELEPVTTLALSVIVTPVVATLSAPVELRLDGDEIAHTYDVPLRAIFLPDAVHEGDEPLAGMLVRTWQFDYGEMHVWGATGRMLHALVTRYAPDGAELTRSGPSAGRCR